MTSGILVLAAALAGVFADHAVLQRERPVAVWGTGQPEEKVEVSFDGQTLVTTADTNGCWRVDLAPMKACREGRDLVVRAASGTQTLHDVLVGEVWFVGGQSNAVCPLWYERGVHFRDQQGGTVAQYLDLPLVRFSNERGGWHPFTPANLADCVHDAGSDRHSLSGLATYFARELFLALGCDVPVGVIGVYANGTGIDTWIPPEGYATRTDLDDMKNWVRPKKWTKACAVGPIVAAHQQPSYFFQERVRRWTPWTIRGLLWNQGDSNRVDAHRYTAKLHALWNGWSKLFENPELPFIYNEQCHTGGEEFELVRSQLAFSVENPHAAMVAVNDIIMPDVHGMRKEPLARRMVLQALRRVYGRKEIRSESPRPASATGSNDTVTVEFAHARTLYVYNETTTGTDCNLELADAAGNWKKAEILNFAGKAGGWASDGYVREPRLVLRAKGIAVPVRVRYLVRPPIHGNLYNDAALPAYPFDIPVARHDSPEPVLRLAPGPGNCRNSEGDFLVLKDAISSDEAAKNATLKTAGGPLIQAHRGGRFEYEDNAAGGFARSLKRGLRGFETDIRFSKDHELVIMHDARVDRTTDGTGIVEEMTLAELKRCRLQACSEPVPTLGEVLDTLEGRRDIFIELEMKASPGKFYAPEVLEEYCRKLNALAKAKLAPGTYAFTCFHVGTLETMRKVDSAAPLGYIMGRLTDAHIKTARRLGCCSVAPTLGTPKEMIDRAHAAGLTVCLWMVQNASDYAVAKEKGADRVTSDYPHLLDCAIRGSRKKLVAMDLDATLCQHRSPIPEANLAALKALEGKYKCIMVGAGNAPRIYRQMGNHPIDIVGNYGMQVAEAADGNFRIVKAVTNTVDRAFFRRETDRLRAKYGYTEYEGNPLEFHASGMVTFGLLGTSPAAERKVRFDPDRRKRRAMYPEVCRIFKDYSVYIGGSTSFDFAGPKYNKYDATLDWAKAHGYTLDDIVFIGDDFADGGGDSHVRIRDMDHIVIRDYRHFASAVGVLLNEGGCDNLIAHRGESHDAPENTLPAYRTAVERGFGFECDIYLSKDKRLFTFHDGDLSRTTDGANTNRCVDALWDGEVSKVNVGGWGKWKGSKFDPTRPALLAEVLDLARDGRWIYVEVKGNDPSWVPHIKAEFARSKKANSGNVLFISFGDRVCAELKRQMPDYRVYWLTECVKGVRDGKRIVREPTEIVAKLRALGVDGVDISYDPSVVDAAYVKAVREAGFSFHVWTVDDPALARKAFAAGVETLTTNRAKHVNEAMNHAK